MTTEDGSPARLAAQPPAAPPAWRVVLLGDVDSTQEVAKRMLASGVDAARTVVRARSQSAGRGRRGGSWRSGEGGSYQTFVTPAGRLPAGGAGLTLAVGVALAEALGAAGARCKVKWPNDLYYRDRKLGGVLVERVREHLLLGVGINVENDVPPTATALRSWSLPAVEELVLEAVGGALAAAVSDEGAVPVPAALRRRYAALDWLAGKRVTVGDAEAVGTAAPVPGSAAGAGEGWRVSGVARGIDERGCLLLSSATSEAPIAVCAGTVVAVEAVG